VLVLCKCKLLTTVFSVLWVSNNVRISLTFVCIEICAVKYGL